MRRPRRIISAGLIIALAIASRSHTQVAAPIATVGPQILSAADLNVSPANPPDVNRKNLQAAYDKLAATGGQITFPAGPPISLDRGIIADSNLPVGFKGAGQGLTTLRIGGGGNGITTGIRRALRATSPGFSPTLTQDQFVDLATLGVDKTAVSGPGQRWGFYTRGHANIAQQGGPWDLGRGDGYRSARVLTISLLLDFSRVTDAQWNQMSVWGMSIHGVPCPVGLAIVRGQFFLMIGTTSTVDPFADLPVVSNYWITGPSVPRGLCRFHGQINADTGQVLAWVDNKQAVVTPQNTPLKPGRSFNANRFAPCGFGSLGENAAVASDFTGGPSDLGILGARIADLQAFTNAGSGNALARIDGQPVADSVFFDAKLPGTIATLPLVDQPADVITTRTITTAPSGTATVFDRAHTNNLNTTVLGPVEGLTIQLMDPKYGSVICTGLSYFGRIEKCTLAGGARGIGAYNLGANYPVTILDCSIGGSDTPVYLYYASIVSLERISLTSAYRDGIRLYRCADVWLKKIFSPNYNTPDFGIMAAKSAIQIDGLTLDNESAGQGCQVAAIYLSPDDSVPFVFSSLMNINDAGAGPHASTLMIDDERTTSGVCGKVALRGVRLWNPKGQASVVRVIGTPSRWTLDCEQAYPIPIPWIEGPVLVPPPVVVPTVGK